MLTGRWQNPPIQRLPTAHSIMGDERTATDSARWFRILSEPQTSGERVHAGAIHLTTSAVFSAARRGVSKGESGDLTPDTCYGET